MKWSGFWSGAALFVVTVTSACTADVDPDAPASATIGVEGGSLSSGDGRLLLEVPAGALQEATTVRIEPIDNDSPRGLGRAYRLSPAGLTFEAPVKVTFQLASDSAGEPAPGGLGIAFRRDGGAWSALVNREVDAGARRVWVSTTHFSDWALFEMFTLEPADASVLSGGAVGLEVKICVEEPDEESLITPLLPTCAPVRDALVLGWSVNGIPDGDGSVGTVASQGGTATYTAPTTIPTNNPVAVSAQVGLTGRAKGLLVANVTVEADCPVPICRLVGTATYTDDSGDGFVVTGEAQVTWTYSGVGNSGEAIYSPSGTVSAAWAEAGCTITLSPSSSMLLPTDGRLAIDFSKSPPTYSGTGSSEWAGTQTWTCGGDPFQQSGITARWFGGMGSVSGDIVEGSQQTAQVQSSWRFVAQ